MKFAAATRNRKIAEIDMPIVPPTSFNSSKRSCRALAANAVQGVSTGFTRELDIVGIGYRADIKGRVATFTLGYSHPIELLLPEGVDLKIDKQTHLVLSGHDKQLVGQVAANMRGLRKPDPYKNKGVRYTGEPLRKKEGKTGAGAK